MLASYRRMASTHGNGKLISGVLTKLKLGEGDIHV